MAEVKPRAAERRRCYLGARFAFNSGHSSIEAVVRNISPLGARIEADDLSIVPAQFDLLTTNFSGGDSRRRARRVWSRHGAMGVAFIAGTPATPVGAETAGRC